MTINPQIDISAIFWQKNKIILLELVSKNHTRDDLAKVLAEKIVGLPALLWFGP